MKKFRATIYVPNGTFSRSVDLLAEDREDAFRQGYQMLKKYSVESHGMELSVEEFPEGPSPIGLCFTYRDTCLKKDFSECIVILAENEEQAREYYDNTLKGTRFWFDPGKIEPDGKNIRGDIRETYFAACPGYDFDATQAD